jgi:hypothetical protein
MCDWRLANTFCMLLSFVKIIEFGITYFDYLMNMKNHASFELAYAFAEHCLFFLLPQFNVGFL